MEESAFDRAIREVVTESAKAIEIERSDGPRPERALSERRIGNRDQINGLQKTYRRPLLESKVSARALCYARAFAVASPELGA